MSNLKIFTNNIEEKASTQINTLIEQPAFSDCKIRIMPDVHAGAGCVIGFTADLGDKVIPNIVGVDIGCGMLTIELGDIQVNFERLDKTIRKDVPSGMNVHDRPVTNFNRLEALYCFEHLFNVERIKKSIGTLGGGNHFIEIDEDDEHRKYLIIHSGSRNLGKQVAEYYQNLAIETLKSKNCLRELQEELIAKCKLEGRSNEIQKEIEKLHKNYTSIPNELCYLTGNNRKDYLHDMRICQEYASFNRYMIGYAIGSSSGGNYTSYLDEVVLKSYDQSMFETIHNYIDYESNIVRKGAISAKKGERVLIPINMRDGCIIGVGKGNEDWNCSAPHGAGRVMSRMKAREQVTLNDFQESMKGVYSTSVNQFTVDESPMVYKPIEEIISNVQDTVKIEKIIKPLYNFKASK